MSFPPKITVIIPTYGAPELLRQAISSVLVQTFKNFELIVVDDNEPNSKARLETAEIIEYFQGIGRNIIYIQHSKNKNGAAARNTGLKRARGEYVCFLDSDDTFRPEHFQNSLQALKHKGDGVMGVYSRVEFRRNGKKYAVTKGIEDGSFLAETLACRFKLGTGSNLFIKRDVLEELGGFDESFRRHQDFEMMVRYFEKYRLIASQNITIIKNQIGDNHPPYHQFKRIKYRYLEKYSRIIDYLPDDKKKYIYWSNYILLAEDALRQGLRSEACQMYKLAGERGSIGIINTFRRTLLWCRSWGQ